MKFEIFVESLRNNKNKVVLDTILEGYSLLFEATLDEIHEKYYPKFDKNEFITINKADPTSKGGNKKGKFLPWLLKLRMNGNLKIEDLSKATKYLTVYAKYRQKLPQSDINKVESLTALLKLIKPVMVNDTESTGNNEIPEEMKSKNDIKKEIKNEVVKHYENDDILVLTPKTHRAACLYGKGTEWCTASSNNPNPFNQYNTDGPLYIVIDKNDADERYQFHPESDQFMDIHDSEIDEIPEILYENKEALKSIAHVLIKFLDTTEIKEYLSRDDLVKAVNGNLKYFYEQRGVVKFNELDKEKIRSKYNVQDIIQVDDTEYFVIDRAGNNTFIELLNEYDIVKFTEEEIYEWYMDNNYDIKDTAFDLSDLTEESILALVNKFKLNPSDIPKQFSDWEDMSDNFEQALEFLNEVYNKYSPSMYETAYISELMDVVASGSDKFKVIKLNNEYALIGDVREIIEDEDSYDYDNDFQMPSVDIDTEIRDVYPDDNYEYFNELVINYIDEDII